MKYSVDKEATWLLKLGGSELEYLTNTLEMVTSGRTMTGAELASLMSNFSGQQGKFLKELAPKLRAELDREFPPEEFGEVDE